jgi:hypothetical protein
VGESVKRIAYLDTNIYSVIAEQDEAASVRDLLRSRGWDAMASSLNILEAWAISSEPKRRRVIRALTTVASCYEKVPQSYSTARELLYELRRRRPGWVRSVAFDRTTRAFLKNNQEHWRCSLRRELPPSESNATYRRVAGATNEHILVSQKALRRGIHLAESPPKLGIISAGKLRTVDVDLSDPETFWRVESMNTWHLAIVHEHPGIRDYRDYLAPHLKREAFLNTASYQDFWLREAEADHLPLNRIIGLTAYAQLAQKITRGNNDDRQHGSYLPSADIFVTADRGLFQCLEWVVQRVETRATPRLVDAGAASTCREIELVLDAHEPV